VLSDNGASIEPLLGLRLDHPRMRPFSGNPSNLVNNNCPPVMTTAGLSRIVCPLHDSQVVSTNSPTISPRLHTSNPTWLPQLSVKGPYPYVLGSASSNLGETRVWIYPFTLYNYKRASILLVCLMKYSLNNKTTMELWPKATKYSDLRVLKDAML
jgi:hypothetical protein